MYKIVFLGPPGGGKGSQAQRVAPELGIPHISTGAMLREAIGQGTELGLKAKAIVEGGGLVPDDLMIGLIRERIAQPDCEKGYLLDGFPRTLAQAEAFDAAEKLTHVVNLFVPQDVIMSRLTGRRACRNGHTTHLNELKDGKCPVCGAEVTQRDDDKPETVRVRFEVYEKQTEPLIGYYRAKGSLYDVPGDGSIEDVRRSVLAVLTR